MDLILSILITFLQIMWLAIFARAIISWFDPRGSNPISRFLIEFTEPVIAPIRSFMPRTGMFDLSPMIAILLILLLMQMLSSVANA